MKKIYSAIIIMAGLVGSQFALANKDVAPAAGYFSAKNVPAIRAMTRSLSKTSIATMVPATDITVANGSTDIIFVFVPNTSIDDMIYPLENDHIRNYSYYGSTAIVLEDRYHNAFFTQYVCRYAMINVYGMPGSYHVVIDSEYCD
jgi:hypothetical protein